MSDNIDRSAFLVERYERLIEKLQAVCAEKATEGDPQNLAGTLQLGLVLNFLMEDPQVAKPEAVTPLIELFAACHDLTTGASPAYFKSRSKRAGAPNRRFRDLGRAHLIEAVDALNSTHMTVVEAAKVVSRMTKENGRRVSAQSIQKWREQANSRKEGSPLTREAREMVRVESRPKNMDRKTAMDYAKGLVEAFVKNDFP